MSRPLRIAIASGKGGTGKTTIATNLAVALADAGARTAYVDCDVEEPNGHIFLRPILSKSSDVAIPVPEVDEMRCTLCGACGKVCRYSAILMLPKQVLTFPKLVVSTPSTSPLPTRASAIGSTPSHARAVACAWTYARKGRRPWFARPVASGSFPTRGTAP